MKRLVSAITDCVLLPHYGTVDHLSAKHSGLGWYEGKGTGIGNAVAVRI